MICEMYIHRTNTDTHKIVAVHGYIIKLPITTWQVLLQYIA